jgi:thiol-disulfide isomerase/thioredoxin
LRDVSFLFGPHLRKFLEHSMFKRFAACIAVVAACTCSPAQAGNESHVADSLPGPSRAVTPSAGLLDGFGQGGVERLANFRGKVVLLSFWASWCAPCRNELTSLDRLQAMLGGADFIVVPISVDGSESAIKSTYSNYGVSHLGIYQELSDDLPQLLGVDRLPTNIVVNREGSVVTASTGATQWDSPRALDMIKSLIRRPGLLPAAEQASLPHRSGPRAFFAPAAAPFLDVP